MCLKIALVHLEMVRQVLHGVDINRHVVPRDGLGSTGCFFPASFRLQLGFRLLSRRRTAVMSRRLVGRRDMTYLCNHIYCPT